MNRPLPEFEKPPVVEVALSVQFEELALLQVPQLGYVWQTFRDRFPKTEEQPLLEPAFEQFGPNPGSRQTVRLELSAVPRAPRLWFLNDQGTELVQIQSDRFVRNWRKRECDGEYPRYKNLRERFCDDLEEFRRLVASEQWGNIEPNQCEVTYVNIIPAGEGWDGYGQLGQVLSVFSARCSDEHLGQPEEAGINVRYVLNDDQGRPVGRLYIVAKPVFRIADKRAAIRLTLTARGKPEGAGIDGAMRFLDRGRAAIVRGFASITTAEMHRLWKRTS